eukprot:10346196-Alexandrium_andersonii.AAC.1
MHGSLGEGKGSSTRGRVRTPPALAAASPGIPEESHTARQRHPGLGGRGRATRCKFAGSVLDSTRRSHYCTNNIT